MGNGDWTKQHIGQVSSTCDVNEIDEHCSCGKNCIFKNIDGTCVFESCLYDERPKENYGGEINFVCPVCLETTSRNVRDLVVGRIAKDVEEDLPKVGVKDGWTCIFCGSTCDRSKRVIPFHNICKECVKELKQVIEKHTC